MTDPQVSAKDLLGDPGFLAYKFDFNSETVAFLPVEPGELREVSSLKREYFDPARSFINVPVAELAALLQLPDEEPLAHPPRFIFHTAYCASTFLSRCLHADGITVALREPQILLDAANAKRLGWRSRTTALDYRHLPKLALRLLQKHATAGEKLVIKPINSVNNIVPELLQLTGSNPSLMLYTDARNFILSTLRKGEGGKQTVRSMFDLLRCDFPHLSNLQLTHTIHMTDLRVIMTLWRLQLEQAEQLLKKYSPDRRIASLYGDDLIENPGKCLQAANEFLGLGIPAEQIDAIANSEERHVDAKNPGEVFSLARREEAYQRLEAVFGDDINDGLEWLIANNPGTRVRPRLSGPLPV